MEHHVSVNWMDHMKFAADVSGHTVYMDAKPEFGGQDEGASPKKLVLAGLAGCTGIDVVSLLNKMRVPFEGLDIEVTGKLTEEHPKYYDQIHVIYKISGKNLDRDKVERAVQLSKERYCGVSAMLEKAATITFEIQYLTT